MVDTDSQTDFGLNSHGRTWPTIKASGGSSRRKATRRQSRHRYPRRLCGEPWDEMPIRTRPPPTRSPRDSLVENKRADAYGSLAWATRRRLRGSNLLSVPPNGVLAQKNNTLSHLFRLRTLYFRRSDNNLRIHLPFLIFLSFFSFPTREGI